MRERIWHEMTRARFNTEFTSLYTYRQRSILRWFNILVLVFSTGGVMGWKVWDSAPTVACVIIAGVSLLRLVQPHLLPTDKMLNHLNDIYEYYAKYYDNIERLWFDFDANRITEEQAMVRFYDLKANESDTNKAIGEAVRYTSGILTKKAEQHSNDFFTRNFNTAPL